VRDARAWGDAVWSCAGVAARAENVGHFMLQVAQGGRLKEPRGPGVATYRAGQTSRRSLVLWVVFKQSVTELCYSVVTALLLCGDRYM